TPLTPLLSLPAPLPFSLAPVPGTGERLSRRYRDLGMTDEDAFRHSAESVTGPISKTISKHGLDGVYRRLDPEARQIFAEAYSVAYPVGVELIEEIYDEGRSGNEIRSVVLAGERLEHRPVSKIDQAQMWLGGQNARPAPLPG